MEDQDMVESFDFSNLSLDSSEDRLQRTFQQIQLEDHSAHPSQTHALASDSLSSQLLSMQEQQHEGSHAESSSHSTKDTDGVWVKLPSADDVNPYPPGMTARRLDAMAADPNHVFKSSTTPSDFSFTNPPGSDPTKSKTKAAPAATAAEEAEKLPDWMLADEVLDPNQPNWSQKDTYGSKDFAVDWSTVPDISTAIDQNILFGFSSFPTFESLSISNVIAEEQNRKTMKDHPSQSDPQQAHDDPKRRGSGMREGGFARFGNTVHGDGEIAPTFGRRGSAASQHGIQWDERPSSTTADSRRVWNAWRTEPQNDILDVDEDLTLQESPQIKATPGFAPAQYLPDSI